MLLQFDGTLIVMALSFIVFMVIMQKIFYAPMNQIREEREAYINQNLVSARTTSEESENIADDYASKITQTRIKATNIVLDSTSVANKEKSVTIEKTENEVNNQLKSERQSILNDKNEARDVLKTKVISLAHSISAKVLGEEIPLSGISEDMIDKIMKK